MSQELAYVYAALLLNDGGAEITADKLQSVLSAAGVSVDPLWAGMYADYFAAHDVAELVKAVNLGGAAPAGGAAAPAGGAAAADAPKEEEKEEEAAEPLALDDMFGDW